MLIDCSLCLTANCLRICVFPESGLPSSHTRTEPALKNSSMLFRSQSRGTSGKPLRGKLAHKEVQFTTLPIKDMVHLCRHEIAIVNKHRSLGCGLDARNFGLPTCGRVGSPPAEKQEPASANTASARISPDKRRRVRDRSRAAAPVNAF